MIARISQHLQRIKARGADYVDARYYPADELEYYSCVQGNLKSTHSTRTTGIGVRVLCQGAWGFAASSTLDDLEGVFDRAFDNARVAAQRVTFPACFARTS